MPVPIYSQDLQDVFVLEAVNILEISFLLLLEFNICIFHVTQMVTW